MAPQAAYDLVPSLLSPRHAARKRRLGTIRFTKAEVKVPEKSTISLKPHGEGEGNSSVPIVRTSHGGIVESPLE